MGHGQGFAAVDSGKQLAFESDQQQRTEIIERSQKEIAELKDKITLLKSKVASLESDLALAFSERLKTVEAREEKARTLSAEIARLNASLSFSRQEFQDTRLEWVESNKKERAEIVEKIAVNESLIKTIQARQKEMEALENRVNDYGGRLAKQDDELAARSRILDGREKNLEAIRKENQETEAKLNALRNSVKDEERMLAVSRSINKNQISELDDLRRRLDTSKADAEAASEKLKADIEQNRLLCQDAIEVAKGNKEKETKLRDWENELKVQDKDLKKRTQDLDEREARIKNLEKERG